MCLLSGPAKIDFGGHVSIVTWRRGAAVDKRFPSLGLIDGSERRSCHNTSAPDDGEQGKSVNASAAILIATRGIVESGNVQGLMHATSLHIRVIPLVLYLPEINIRHALRPSERAAARGTRS